MDDYRSLLHDEQAEGDRLWSLAELRRRERDEARAIAGELARYLRILEQPLGNGWLDRANEARDAIRPGVRKFLEGK
jgi:hypothetical protein